MRKYTSCQRQLLFNDCVIFHLDLHLNICKKVIHNFSVTEEYESFCLVYLCNPLVISQIIECSFFFCSIKVILFMFYKREERNRPFHCWCFSIWIQILPSVVLIATDNRWQHQTFKSYFRKIRPLVRMDVLKNEEI